MFQHDLAFGDFISLERKLRSAAFAFPSDAGARSLIFIAAPCSPRTLSTFAFGTT
jgi:hypothetical protein